MTTRNAQKTFRDAGMGNLLRLLSREDNSCCSYNKFDFFLDFESEYLECLVPGTPVPVPSVPVPGTTIPSASV
ncbi:hypothetical protein FHG87_002123 [Trinorchestia longiramus]|nr:hypothetical protein FHG87_002123 [Trinorchestia longiramus]